jgi:hypothetical protein
MDFDEWLSKYDIIYVVNLMPQRPAIELKLPDVIVTFETNFFLIFIKIQVFFSCKRRRSF